MFYHCATEPHPSISNSIGHLLINHRSNFSVYVMVINVIKACTHMSIKSLGDAISIENFPSFEIAIGSQYVVFCHQCKYYFR
jgi:hypothetical protein